MTRMAHPMVAAIAAQCRDGGRDFAAPVLAMAHGYAAAVTDTSMKAFFTSPATSLAAQLEARESLGYGDPPSLLWADFGAFELGGRNRWPSHHEDTAPVAAQRPVRNARDIEHLEVPKMADAGSAPLVLEFCKGAVAAGCPAVVRAGTPTLVAASVAGFELLGQIVQHDRGAAHLLFEKVTLFLIELLDAVIDQVGPSQVWPYVGGACDSAPVVHRSLFAELGAAYQEKINLHLRRRGVNQAFVHLCGDHRDRLDVWAGLSWPGPSLFSLASGSDLVRCAEVLGGEHAVAGAVPTGLLETGTPDQVRAGANLCLKAGEALPGRFVLAPECDLPVLSPRANVQAFIEAAMR